VLGVEGGEGVSASEGIVCERREEGNVCGFVS
jgi:hypothetical protein